MYSNTGVRMFNTGVINQIYLTLEVLLSLSLIFLSTLGLGVSLIEAVEVLVGFKLEVEEKPLRLLATLWLS